MPVLSGCSPDRVSYDLSIFYRHKKAIMLGSHQIFKEFLRKRIMEALSLNRVNSCRIRGFHATNQV